MKPVTAASGVRNSWLALAMKSARNCSLRLTTVRSCSSSAVTGRRQADARGIGLVMPLDRHRQAEGHIGGDAAPAPRRLPPALRDCADTDDARLRSRPGPSTSRMEWLTNSTRSSSSSSITGMGSWSSSTRVMGGKRCQGIVGRLFRRAQNRFLEGDELDDQHRRQAQRPPGPRTGRNRRTAPRRRRRSAPIIRGQAMARRRTKRFNASPHHSPDCDDSITRDVR